MIQQATTILFNTMRVASIGFGTDTSNIHSHNLFKEIKIQIIKEKKATWLLTTDRCNSIGIDGGIFSANTSYSW
jgi:hypothetical protein